MTKRKREAETPDVAVDHYKILEVEKNAKEEELRRSYKRLAMKWHPDKNLTNKEEAESMFKKVSEAYEVLSDSHKRALFDCSLMARVAPAAPAASSTQKPLQKAPPIERKLSCTLEELYTGTTKKVNIWRKFGELGGKDEGEVLVVEVKPGWKNGTKIKYLEMGIRVPNMIPADLVFIIEEELHRVYTRVGADLLVTKTISLVEALTGYTVKLVTLDGRNLTVPIDNVIHPEYEEIVENEGLPHHKDPTKKGNLRIRFKITFPPDLTLHQKVEMRKFLTD
ncbi:dnaJ homolog subfamily B member 13-like [Vigna unguiculata]|uniref:dnaJ homolog subfamily B member 13-like n=1 Tax=Vigna unguiculata TaxID=3917 RepID=UPI0010171B89|nr:dnaJ homolog subfamily B member 13-like [Vigna unguiculata]